MELEALYDEAVEKYDEGDFAAAFAIFSQLDERDHADAQNYLGIMFGAGLGVEKDDKKSLLYHQRAVHNSPRSHYLYALARQYEIMGNRRRALYWWNQAYEQGDKSSSLQLAKRLLQNPRGNSKKRAAKLLQFTASGNPPMDISEDEQEEALDLLDELEA